MQKATVKGFRTIKPIYEATPEEYGWFYLFPFNRDVRHTRKLADSISEMNYLMDTPMLCIERKEDGMLGVIDGQGRLAAAMLLNLNIYFFITSYTSFKHEMIVLNSGQTNWDLYGYQKFYIWFNEAEYIALNELLSRTEVRLPDVVYSIWTKGNAKIFQQGEFTMTTQLEHDIILTDKMYKIIVEHCHDKNIKLSRLMRACNKFHKTDGFCLNKFSDKFNENGLLFTCRSSEEDNVRELNRICNM